MKMKLSRNRTFKSAVLLFLGAVLTAGDTGKKTIKFKALDGLTITGDLYAPHQDKSTAFIVLFHQAGWSRGEYVEIAPELNALGFNCLAIDQRSGGTVNDVENETYRRAVKENKSTTYIHAKQDLEAALVKARSDYGNGKIIAWGSSYSAALVLALSSEKPQLADAVLAFSPGEYFQDLGKAPTWVQESTAKIDVPVFITSARSEHEIWIKIFQAVPHEEKLSFIPETTGNHGSRALWSQFADSPQYWSAVKQFLIKYVAD